MADRIYQLKISLNGITPQIWRRVLVEADISLSDLHDLLQSLFGWDNSHLHQFFPTEAPEISDIFSEFEDPEELASLELGVPLSMCMTKVKSKMKYTYDFGDDWEHILTLEKILPFEDTQLYPVCLDGKRAAPPEDCGGIWGYQELLKTLSDPESPEYEERMEWVGGEFDPEEFSVKETNLTLQLEKIHSFRNAHLIEADVLNKIILNKEKGIRIVDVRGMVKITKIEKGVEEAEYLGAREDYAKSHIPGAVYIDWTSDIVDLDDPVPVQLAGPEKFKATMEAAGIGDDDLVVIYDSHPASQFATRLWWALRYYGHDSAVILNGGWKAWMAQKLPVTSKIPPKRKQTFTPEAQPHLKVSAETIAERLKSGSITLFDVRDKAQFDGSVRRGKRGGRIPGAVHLPREVFFDEDGLFLSQLELMPIVSLIIGDNMEDPVAYCNGGVAATTAVFAFSMIGLLGLPIYDGSWNEWSQREELPVESPSMKTGI